MHTSVLIKKILPFFVVFILLGISTVCIYYILANTIWTKKVLPKTSIQGEDISLNSEAKLYEIYEKNFSLPDYIDIQIEDIKQRLYLHEIDARYSPSADEILGQGKFKIDEFVANIDLIYTQKEYAPVVVLDETKLAMWLDNNFESLPIEPKLIPKIDKAYNGEITLCEAGKEGTVFPKESIHNAILNYKTESDFKFELEEIAFDAQELATSKLCGQIDNFKTNITAANDSKITSPILSALFNSWEVPQYFAFKEEQGKLKISIKNESSLKTFLAQKTANFEVAEVIPEYREYAGIIYFLGEYIPSQKVDITTTIENLKHDLISSEENAKLNLVFANTTAPTIFLGKPVKSFSKLVSNGQAKFPYSKKKDETIKSINKGLAVLNGRFIPAQSDYSLIEDGLEARVYLYTQNGPLLANDGNYSYNAGICGVATVMYRASLLAGFGIKERHPHIQAISGYTYPYNILVDAALYFRADIKQDLEVVNDYNYEILIVTDSKLENNEFKYNVRFFAPVGSSTKNVRLGDFVRENYVKGLPFKERFTRYVDGVPEITETKYYIDEL